MTDPAGKERQIVQARWLTGLLATTFVVTDLALLVYATSDRLSQEKWIGYVLIGSAFGQTALTSTLLVWSRLPIAIRILACSACLAFLAVLGNRGDANDELWSAEWFGGVMLFGLLTLIPFQLLRWWGFSLALADEVEAHQSADQPNSGARRAMLQFSIWGIMTATTVCAVLLAAGRFAQSPAQTMLEHYVVFLTLLITAVVTWWVILLPRGEAPFPPFLAMVGLIAWYMLGSFVLKRPLDANSGSPGAVLVNTINGGNVALAAIVMRVAGLRLVCRSNTAQSALRKRPD